MPNLKVSRTFPPKPGKKMAAAYANGVDGALYYDPNQFHLQDNQVYDIYFNSQTSSSGKPVHFVTSVQAATGQPETAKQVGGALPNTYQKPSQGRSPEKDKEIFINSILKSAIESGQINIFDAVPQKQKAVDCALEYYKIIKGQPAAPDVAPQLPNDAIPDFGNPPTPSPDDYGARPEDDLPY